MAVTAHKDHVVDFYLQDDHMVERVSAYLAAALSEGVPAVIAATEGHALAIEAVLGTLGVDVEAARRSGDWVVLDAASTLGRLKPGGQFDPEAFITEVGSVLREVSKDGRPVRVYGEMVQLLWEQGDINGAIALESLWNEMGRELEFSLYCSYRAAEGQEAHDAVEKICQLHSEVAYRHGWPGFRKAEAEFDPDPSAPCAARRFMRGVLGEWAWAGALEAADLVITELATNALLHARSSFKVVLSESPSALRVSVHDHNRDLPSRYPRELEAFSGRGLVLVEAMSVQWGCAVRADGKEVWADVLASSGDAQP